MNKPGKGLRVGRRIAALYLALYGVLGLLCLPGIRDPLLDYLRATYPNITWRPDPYPLRAVFLSPIAIISAVGVLRRRQWALWLGTGVLLAEIPFLTHAQAHSMWSDQQGSVLLYQINGVTFEEELSPVRYFVTAFLFSAAFNGFFVFLLRPWRRQHGPVAQRGQIIKPTKTNKFVALLPFAVVAGLAVMGYLGYRGIREQSRKQRGALKSEIGLKPARPATYTSETLKKERERLERENARRSREILDDSLTMELFVNSEQSDTLIRRFDNDLAATLPVLKPMLSGEKRSKMDAIICLGKIGKRSQANGKIAIPLLREALKAHERPVRTLAATMLIRLGEKTEAIPVLLETLTTNPDTEELSYAVGGLMEAKAEVKNRAAISVLMDSLTHQEQSIVIFSARILVNSHFYREVIPPMLNMLRSPQREIRYCAATILWMMGPNAKSALPSLEAAHLAETDSEVAVTMMLAIAAIKGG